MLADELREAGYDVTEAFNADEAWSFCGPRACRHDPERRAHARIHGRHRLLRVVRSAYPKIPVIITSAHLQPPSPQLTVPIGSSPSPIKLELVVKAVQEELANANDQ